MVDVQFQNKINQQLNDFFLTKQKLVSRFDPRIGELIEQIVSLLRKKHGEFDPHFQRFLELYIKQQLDGNKVNSPQALVQFLNAWRSEMTRGPTDTGELARPTAPKTTLSPRV